MEAAVKVGQRVPKWATHGAVPDDALLMGCQTSPVPDDAVQAMQDALDAARAITPPQPLKVGDVVQLKSGGPAMTVNGVTRDGFDCVWFDPSDIAHGETFQAAMLRLVAGHPGNAK